MNTIGENLWGGQNVLERDLKALIRGSHLRNVLGLCLFAVAFYFAYRYGMAFSHVTSSPFWFPDSVLLCTLLVVRPSRWWVFILAALPIRLLLSVPEGVPLWFLLATFANDSAKGLLVAAALRRFLRNPVRFETVRDFALYCLFAVLLVPAASAFGGAAARYFLGSDFWLAWEQWFLGDVVDSPGRHTRDFLLGARSPMECAGPFRETMGRRSVVGGRTARDRLHRVRH